jgi:hypothetical protein
LSEHTKACTYKQRTNRGFHFTSPVSFLQQYKGSGSNGTYLKAKGLM